MKGGRWELGLKSEERKGAGVRGFGRGRMGGYGVIPFFSNPQPVAHPRSRVLRRCGRRLRTLRLHLGRRRRGGLLHHRC